MKSSGILVSACLLLGASATVTPLSAAEGPVTVGPGGPGQQLLDGRPKQAETATGNLAGHVTESAAYLGEAVNLAVRSHGRPYLHEVGDYIVIGNAHVAAVFRAANNELVGIVDIHNGGRMLAYGDNPLWKLTMASPGYMPDAERSLEEVPAGGWCNA